MKVICAWCEAEGKPAVVREKEQLEDTEKTHGLCAEHKEKLGDASNDAPVSGGIGAG
jgi:hypothetical protein